MLSEQVSAQNGKITDLERLINDKTQLVSNTEDLLQRVSEMEIVRSKRIFFYMKCVFNAGNVIEIVTRNTKA